MTDGAVGAGRVPALTGTVIHGTMRPEDLVPAFVEALRVLDPGGARAAAVIRDAEAADLSDPDAADWTLEKLSDALDDALPVGWYFGPVEGDPTDYGIWKTV